MKWRAYHDGVLDARLVLVKSLKILVPRSPRTFVGNTACSSTLQYIPRQRRLVGPEVYAGWTYHNGVLDARLVVVGFGLRPAFHDVRLEDRLI